METHLTIIVAAYFIFASVAVISEVNRIRYGGLIGIGSLCRMLYILLVVIVPACIYCGYLMESITSSSILYDDKFIWTFYIGAIYTILVYLMFGFGYKIKQRDIPLKDGTMDQNVVLISTIFTIISFVALVLWASGFGGINQLINDANSIRAGFIGSSSNVAFFKHFVPLSMLSVFLLFYYLFIDDSNKGKRKVIYAIILFVPSIIISVVYILANDGRMLAGIFIMLLFLLKLKNDYEIKGVSLKYIFFKLFVITVIVALLILNADNIFRLFRGTQILNSNETNSILKTITKEFSFIVTGLQTAIVNRFNETAEFMLKNDIGNGIFAWLPTSLKPVSYVDVWDYNTKLINSGGYGQAPTSIVAQSLYDFGMIGCIIIPAFYGFIVRKVEKILNSYPNNTFMSTIYIVLGFYLAKGMAYFSMYNIMMNIFFIVVACIIYWMMKKITLGRK